MANLKTAMFLFPPPDYQDHAYLAWFSADVLYSVNSHGNVKFGDVVILVNSTN